MKTQRFTVVVQNPTKDNELFTRVLIGSREGVEAEANLFFSTKNVISITEIPDDGKIRISDLELKLKTLRERYGDNEIVFSVGDYFTVNGQRATMSGLRRESTFHDGTFTNDGVTRFDLYLEDNYDSKHPKITFRA